MRGSGHEEQEQKMNSLDDPKRVERFEEILPDAYLAAAVRKAMGGNPEKPTPFEVGLTCRDISDMAYDKSPAYRIAMSFCILAEIVDVKKEQTPGGAEYFQVDYRELTDKNGEILSIKTPLLYDTRFGPMTKKIWERYDDDGKNFWIGKRMRLYKHNEEPKPEDKSKNGYKRCVFAQALD